MEAGYLLSMASLVAAYSPDTGQQCPVIQETPAANTIVPKNSTVTLTIHTNSPNCTTL